MTTETSTDASAQPAAAPSPGTAADSGVSTRYRLAVGLVALVGVGVIVGTLIALDALRGYQIVLNIIVGAGIVGVAYLLLRGRSRVLAVLITWITAFGILCEAGDHQARINDTGALAATNTSYFLPTIMWIAIIALFLAAFAVTALTKRVRGGA